MCVEEINGEKKDLITAYNFITSSPEMMSEVKGYLGNFNFGIQDDLNVKCNECGSIVTVGLSFRPDFFIPPRRFEHLARNGVQNK